MFEQSVMPPAARTRRPLMVSVSATLQCAAVGLAVLIPLLDIEALPAVKLSPRVPFRSVALLKPQARAAPAQATAMPRLAAPRPMVAPSRVPERVAMVIDGPEMPAAGSPGPDIPGPAGIPGGLTLPMAAPPPALPRAKAPVAAAAAPATTPTLVRAGGDVRPPRLLRDVRPAYPPLARQARVQGQVRLNAIISRDGRIQSLVAVSGHPLLIPAAMDAVRQWVYQPTTLNGEPVEVMLVIDVNFLLAQ